MLKLIQVLSWWTAELNFVVVVYTVQYVVHTTGTVVDIINRAPPPNFQFKKGARQQSEKRRKDCV